MYIYTFIEAKRWQLTFLVCLLTCLKASTQTIENIRDSFDQSRQLMLIYYDLKGLDYKQEIEIIPIFTVDNARKILPSKDNLSGDLGWVNKDGKNKLIIWDPFADSITSLRSFQVYIKTNLRKVMLPTYGLLCLQGSNSAPFGLKIMTLDRRGFFLGFRKSRSAPSYQYKVSNDGVIDYRESGIYKIGSERRLSSYALTAGKPFRLNRNVFAFIGAGYGAERLFWQYEAYNLNGELINKYWALNEKVNRKGIVIDIGVGIRKRFYMVDLGLSTINFTSFQVTASVGFGEEFNVEPSYKKSSQPGRTFYKNK